MSCLTALCSTDSVDAQLAVSARRTAARATAVTSNSPYLSTTSASSTSFFVYCAESAATATTSSSRVFRSTSLPQNFDFYDLA